MVGSRYISFINFKGGIGKTSSVLNIADYLARQGKNVVVIDGDRQRNATSIIPGFDIGVQYPKTLKQVLMEEVPLFEALIEARPGLYICPSHRDLEKAAKHLTISGRRTQKHLAYEVTQLEGVDYVLIDHAPNYSALSDALLLASEEMIIPVQLEAFSMSGLVDMIDKLTEALAELEHQVAITAIIPSEMDFTKSMTQLYLTSLRETFGERVFPGIRTDAQISRSQSVGKTVYEYNSHSKGAEDYAAIGDILLRERVLV